MYQYASFSIYSFVSWCGVLRGVGVTPGSCRLQRPFLRYFECRSSPCLVYAALSCVSRTRVRVLG